MVSIKNIGHRQRGVVLFIALIVLVVMSLAGIALSRSVETSLGIVGNLAFRKSALHGTDKAVAEAISWIDNNRGMLNRPGEVDALTTGYYFSPAKAKGTDDAWLATYWTNAFDVGADAMGNQLTYKIERMCEDSTKAYADTNCALGKPPTQGQGNSYDATKYQFKAPPPLIFRRSARSVGPKRATSIVQVYYEVPM